MKESDWGKVLSSAVALVVGAWVGPNPVVLAPLLMAGVLVGLLARRGRSHRTQQDPGWISLLPSLGELSPDLMLVVDVEGSLIYGNPLFQAAAGGRAGTDLLALVGEDDRLSLIGALERVARGSSAVQLSFRCLSGRQIEGTLHRWQGGEPWLIGRFRDVTADRQLERETSLSRARATRSLKVEALGRLAGGVAHDFNNLLAIVSMNLDLLSTMLSQDNPARLHVDEISLAVRKATGITRQLLLHSRKKAVKLRRISCRESVLDVRRLTEGLRAGVAFEVGLHATHDELLMEEGQLDQVLLNLVVNAKDAMGPTGTVRVDTRDRALIVGNPEGLPPGDYLSLRVTDNGAGIPAELRDKIFEPYFTTKAIGKGTGLGLSTVAAIVGHAGGHIAVSSRPGETTFEVLLPVPRLPSPEPSPEALPAQLGSRPTVLLVEDEAAIRAMVHRLLEGRGHKVTSVGSATRALELLKKDASFELLITDLILPGGSGSGVARAFGRLRRDAPVLFFSGSPELAVEACAAPSSCHFLAKPFTPSELFSALDQLLATPV